MTCVERKKSYSWAQRIQPHSRSPLLIFASREYQQIKQPSKILKREYINDLESAPANRVDEERHDSLSLFPHGGTTLAGFKSELVIWNRGILAKSYIQVGHWADNGQPDQEQFFPHFVNSNLMENERLGSQRARTSLSANHVPDMFTSCFCQSRSKPRTHVLSW